MLKDMLRGFIYWAFSSVCVYATVILGIRISNQTGFSVIPTFICMTICIIVGSILFTISGEALRKEAEKNEQTEA